MGVCISTFYLSDNVLFTIKYNRFYDNTGDFGVALNFEHRGGLAYVTNNIFRNQINPTKPIGGGLSIKLSGDFRTRVISSNNIHNDSWSAGFGVIIMFSSYLEETNSSFYNNYAFGGCLFCLFQAAEFKATNLSIFNTSGSLGFYFIM